MQTDKMPCPSDCGPMTDQDDRAFEQYVDWVEEDLLADGYKIDDDRLNEICAEYYRSGKTAGDAALMITRALDDE